MSEVKKRKVRSAEFKAKVGMEAVRGVKTLNEIGQQYGVHPVAVGQWKKKLVEQAATLFEGKRAKQIKIVVASPTSCLPYFKRFKRFLSSF